MKSSARGVLGAFLAVGCSTAGGTVFTTTGPGGSGGRGSITGFGGASTWSATTGSGGAGSSSASGSSSSGSFDAGLPWPSDCNADADCPSGACEEVTPGGFRVCTVLPQPTTTCDSPGVDQCCPGVPCPDNATCLAGPLVPVCGVSAAQNQCGVDQCFQDADCLGTDICGVAGTLGLKIRACLVARCKVNADCAEHPGGTCAPVEDPCCGVIAGLFCVYPGHGGCRSNNDCPASPQAGSFCFPDEAGVASCQNGAPTCGE